MRRYPLYLAVVLILGMLPPPLAMLYFQPLVGDLTRIGNLPERAFGWNAAQPALRQATNHPPQDAEVIVLGDSFSLNGQWQGYAFPGRKVAYFQYDRICADFPEVYARLSSRARLVAVQSVEREFHRRFLEPCTKTTLHARPSAPEAAAQYRALRGQDLFTGSFGARYIVGSLAFLVHDGEQSRNRGGKQVVVREVAEGCRYWSNARCDLGLFYGRDWQNPVPPFKSFDSPAIGYLRAAGLEQVVLVVAPNKRSIYLDPPEQIASKAAYFETFARHNRVASPQLFEALYQARERVRDLYAPNDTHFSNAGFILFGDLVRQAVNVPVAGTSPDRR